MKYKAIISDFDGTLVHNNSRLEQPLIDLIQTYIANGGIFCLATGRDFAGDIVQACQDLRLTTPIIASGGAEIIDLHTHQILVSHYLQPEVAQAIINQLRHQPVNVIVSQSGLLYTQKPEFDGPYKDILRNLNDLPHTDKVPKIRITIDPQRTSQVQTMLDQLQQQFSQHITIHQSNTVRSTGFDITSPQATKHLAVLELTRILNLSPQQVVGMGDGYNDYPLLTACGYKVAMAHSPQELLDIADYIAPPHHQGGPLAAIQHILSLS